MIENLHNTTRVSTPLSDTIELVAAALDKAKELHLECETIATAFLFLKDNPEKSIEEALAAGLDDWDA